MIKVRLLLSPVISIDQTYYQFESPSKLLIQMIKNLLFILVLASVSCLYNECLLDLYPLPQNCSIGNPQQNISISPCDITFRIYDKGLLPHFNEVLTQYMNSSYNCSRPNLVLVNSAQNSGSASYGVDVLVLDPSLRSVFSTIEQTYMINADTRNATIRAGTYVSLIRGLDTFLQLIVNEPETSNYSLNGLPLYIFDQPQYTHRGVQVDTARHYLPFQLILETINSMMYNKMNVLHWHITDEDSFPLKLDKHPELAQYGAFSKSQIYTAAQARQVVRYAKVRGIRVIPELDTPGHAASWGRAPANKGLACTLSQYTFIGPLDVTLDQTYKLVKQVFEQILDIFPDPYVHLGGDQVQLACLSNLTSLLKANNITVSDLPMYYRQRQKNIISEMDSTRQRIYWENNFDHLKTFTSNDVIHWWGDGNLPNTTAKVIISTFGPFYIDMGVGNYYGMPYGLYSNWLDLYNQNIYQLTSGYANKGNILGAQVLLWSQLSNKYTHMTKLWLRSSAIAQRLWNPHVQMIKPRVILRMNLHMKRMNARGIPTAPITNQVCEMNPIYC